GVGWWGGCLVLSGPGGVGGIVELSVVGSTSLAAYLGAAFLLKSEEVKWAATLVRKRVGGEPG
ncbi:MAG: hypothetical protein ACFB50_18735, partial [Rubrobacteraceae bacterium]